MLLVVVNMKKWFVIALLVGACTPYQLPSPFLLHALAPMGHDLNENEGASQIIRHYTEEALVKMGTPDGHHIIRGALAPLALAATEQATVT